MKRFEFDEFSGYSFEASDDAAPWYVNAKPELRNYYLDLVIRGFFKRPLFKELVEVYSSRHQLTSHIILEAHANTVDGEWVIFDGDEKRKVQEWVDERDGQASSLMIVACNPDNLSLTSERSVLIYPNRSVSTPSIYYDIGHLRLYCPGFGHFERNNRQLRRTIDVIKSSS